MATYPNALPTTTELPDPGLTHAGPPDHTDLTTAPRDEIIAIAAELGTIPKGAYTSVRERLESMPAGELVYAESDGLMSGATTATDVPGLETGEFTPGAGRLIEVRAHVVGTATDADARVDVLLTDELNAEVQRSSVFCVVAGGATNALLVHRFESTSDPYEFKVRVQRGTGTGSVGVAANTPSLSFLVVEDKGVPS